jgi:alpha-beta hydrolase superfamily lysophospholipase
MQLIKGLNLALAFGLELAMLAALAYWGLETGGGTAARLLLAVGAPAAAVVIWSRWLAPTSGHRLRRPWLKIVTAVMFALAATALYAADQATLAATLGVAAAINVGLGLALGQH